MVCYLTHLSCAYIGVSGATHSPRRSRRRREHLHHPRGNPGSGEGSAKKKAAAPRRPRPHGPLRPRAHGPPRLAVLKTPCAWACTVPTGPPCPRASRTPCARALASGPWIPRAHGLHLPRAHGAPCVVLRALPLFYHFSPHLSLSLPRTIYTPLPPPFRLSKVIAHS